MSRAARIGTLVLAFVAAGALVAGVALSGAAAPATGDTPDRGQAALAGSGASVEQTNGSGASQVRGSPDIDMFLSQPTVPSGGESTVTVDLLNSGEMQMGNQLDPRVTTARSVKVEAEAEDDRLSVTSGEAAIGDVPTGVPTAVPISVSVPDDVSDGEYDIEVTARYRYTRTIVPSQDNHYDSPGTESVDVTIVVDDGARFAILDTETDAQVGGSGDVTATLRNVGDEAARDAVVTGTATGSGAVIGGDGSGEAFVGNWEPGENRTVTFDSTVSPDFGGGAYAFVSTVDYRDRDGIEETAPSSRAGVVPAPEQSFSVEDVEGTLEVGYSGTVSGTLANEGPLDVDDAVLVADPQSQRVSLGESRYALPDIPAGESVEFSFDADVNGNADPGPRQFRFTTEYTSGDSTIAVDETRRIEVAPRQPEFDLVADNTTVPAGETRRISFEITNQRPETLSSINAGLYADSPLSAPNDEAFVDELEPGESTDIWFEVSAAPGASVETHPIELDFRYNDERGNDRISDVSQYPIEVTESTDDGGLPITALVVGLLVVVAGAGAVVWYRRR
ncbi:COG1361 S-layer family protein [Halorubrum salsamenti]|uniref:COG1361 S-layer family protein n=1 Tax=Halorubrum salsamenti TaxID=2583990 RepID=UPI0011A0D99A|nr:COG1361 S-layer family protein [Halorubrum salsamenti]